MKVFVLPGVCAWLLVMLAGQCVQAQYAGMPMNYGDHPGRYAIAPAGHEQGMPAEYDGGPGYAEGGPGGCGPGGCGPGGCGPNGCGADPYGDGGEGDPFGPFECRPRWFNIAFDFIYLTREEVSRTVDFSTQGSRDTDPFAPVVLSTNSLNFQEEPGFRATFQMICGPASNFEAIYFGTLFYQSSARATGNDDLFSAFSGFGTNPVGGFNDSDNAEVQTLEYKSHFDSGELNYRQRYISANGRIQSSLLLGGRYFRVDDNFLFTSSTNRTVAGAPVTGSLSYDTATTNDLFGFQMGGDLSLAVTRCLTFGGELKAGLFGNYAVQKTNIAATVPSAGTFFETATHNSAAFGSEANMFVVLFLTEHLSVRSGYQLVYVDGVALAPENVNFTRAASGSFANRVATIDDSGNVFLHGFTFGAEITW